MRIFKRNLNYYIYISIIFLFSLVLGLFLSPSKAQAQTLPADIQNLGSDINFNNVKGVFDHHGVKDLTTIVSGYLYAATELNTGLDDLSDPNNPPKFRVYNADQTQSIDFILKSYQVPEGWTFGHIRGTEWYFQCHANPNLWIRFNPRYAKYGLMEGANPGGAFDHINIEFIPEPRRLEAWLQKYALGDLESFASTMNLNKEGQLEEETREQVLEDAIRTVLEWTGEMLSWGIELTKSFVNGVVIVTPDDFDQNSGVTSSWAVVRDMSNILFILGVIIIALASVFRVDIEKYDIRILLPKLIIAMILINLSFLMCRAIIDLSNAMSETFIHLNTDLTTEGFNRDDIVQNLFAAIDQDSIEGSLTRVLQAPATGIGLILLAIVMLLVGFVAGLFLMILLLVRIIMIWFLVIISPLLFLFSVLPFTQGLTKTWWTQFSKFVFMGPIICLVLSLGERMAISFGSGSSYWLVPFYSIGMIFAAVVIPMTLGGKIVGAVAGHIQKGGKFAGEKLRNKAWTGKADGKGEMGLRKKMGFADRAKKSEMIHEAAGKKIEKEVKEGMINSARITGGKIENPNIEQIAKKYYSGEAEIARNTSLPQRLKKTAAFNDASQGNVTEFDQDGHYKGVLSSDTFKTLKTNDPTRYNKIQNDLKSVGMWDSKNKDVKTKFTLTDKFTDQQYRNTIAQDYYSRSSTPETQKMMHEVLAGKGADLNGFRKSLNNPDYKGEHTYLKGNSMP